MSTIPSTNAAGATTQAQTGTQSAMNAKGTLDKDGFLKLFIAQLTHQDPTSPMDTNESVNQMASFTMVEQITSMTSSNAQIAKTLTTSNAVAPDRPHRHLHRRRRRDAQDRQGRACLHLRGRRLDADHRRCQRHRPIVHHRRRLIRRPTNKEHSLS